MTLDKQKAENPDPGIPGIPDGVLLTTLDNGLSVILREDHSAPVVSVQAWCMAGSIHEGKWLGAGMSHVLEHMLFKGTKTRPGSRIDQEVQEAGGYMNAYTSFDRTVFHIDVPNTGAKVAIDILCDIMQNATLPSDEMEKEKQVILREMDMNVDDPGRRASRRLFETAFTRSPYRLTIIGYPDIFNELRQVDILDYYREKYAPNNVFFVVVGDVDKDAALGQIREAYAKAKARALPPVVLPPEPTQTAAREIIEEAAIELGHVHFAWHIPELRHPDVPLLDVLAALLGNGRSSRLYREVRDRAGAVHCVDAWTYSPGLTGLFGISANVDGDKYVPAREAILAELDKLKSEGPSSEELTKAVKQFTAATLSARKTMQGQAQDLGSSWLAANDLNFSERYLAAVKRATREQLRQVANKYLTSENRTVYALLPEGSRPPGSSTTSATEDHPIQKFSLPNGLRLLVKESHRLPFVEMRAVFAGGVLAETSQNSGITQLTSKMLIKGAGKRSADELALDIESIGGSLDTYAGNNSFGVNVEVLSTDFDKGLDILADVIRRPTIPESALEREREIQLAAIRAQRDQLLQSAFKGMRRTLFGDDGYGHDTLGTEETVRSLQVAELREFHGKMATPNNCVIAVFGDVKPDLVLKAVQHCFGDWQSSAEMPLKKQSHPTRPCIQRFAETQDKKQAVLVVGWRGTSVENPDRYPLELLQEACSDLGSRLFLRVREELGLAYYVGAQNMIGLAPGYFAFYVGTMPEAAEKVERELLAEAELLRNEGLSAAELQRAKAKVIGQKKIGRQDLGALAMGTALDELYGLGFQHSETEDALYEAVTLEQVKAVANKYLNPDAFVVATVMPATKAAVET